MPKLAIIVASTRPGRLGPVVARWVETVARDHSGFTEVELIDLAEVNLPFMNEPHHPRLTRYTHGHTRAWSARIASADAFVFVMPEYNYGYNAELKNAIDYLHTEWHYKPVGLVSYGGVSAGTRAAQMIKQVVTTLKMTPLSEAVSLPFVQRFIDGEGALVPNEVMTASAAAMLDELARVTGALRPLRTPTHSSGPQVAVRKERRQPMADVSTALIVGGGIAGLSASIALSRAGVRCEVLELADTPGGASITLSGRATEALDELGVYDAFRAAGTAFTEGTTASHQMDAAGRLLSKGPQRPQWSGAKVPLGMHRPAMLRILEEAAQDLGVKVYRGVTTQATDERDDGVFVTLTDGRQARYDFVVGADGIGSRTRSRLFPDAPVPAYSGQFSFRWMLSGPPIEGEGWYIGPEGRLGFYHLPGDRIYVPAVVDLPEGTWLTDEDTHAHFTRLLDSYTAPAVVELRRRLTRDADLIARPFEWILLPAPWHRGRTLLIGDAAHATTAHMGMGGGMAIEDAVVLGQCVAKEPTLKAAFDTFMERRYPRVSTVVETSVTMSRLEQENTPAPEIMATMSAAIKTLAQPY